MAETRVCYRLHNSWHLSSSLFSLCMYTINDIKPQTHKTTKSILFLIWACYFNQSECTVLTACASTFVVYFNVSVVLFKVKLPPRQGRHCELSESVVLSLGTSKLGLKR